MPNKPSQSPSGRVMLLYWVAIATCTLMLISLTTSFQMTSDINPIQQNATQKNKKILPTGFAKANVLAQPLAPELAPSRTHYVLSLALNYGPRDICAFVRSWKLHCPETHIVLFVYEQQLASLSQLGVELVACQEFPVTHAMNQWRFYAFAAYMDERGQQMRGVVLADVRDVLLQRNIWLNPHVYHALLNREILFSLEGNYSGQGKSQNVLLLPDGSFTNADYGATLNMKWIEECFGAEVAGEMQAHKAAVSCAGVTIGSRSVMQSYLREFLRVLESVASEKCKSINGDQAIHNYLLWYLSRRDKLSFNTVALGNGVSPVYTMGYGLPLTVDTMGRVIVVRGPGDQFVPEILHQYDRNGDLALTLRKAYACSAPMQVNTIDSDSGVRVM